MMRLTLALLALSCLLPSAQATQAHQSDAALPAKEPLSVTLGKLPAEALHKAVVREEKDTEFLLTDDTEVLLDGQRCSYKDVPGGAIITEVQLAADKKTILKIAFKTKK
jgi:hypothetical protein